MNSDKKRSIKRPTKPLHYGLVSNQKLFTDAYNSLLEAGVTDYITSAGTPFTAEAGVVKRGRRVGELVIIFKQGKEMARSYPCCWGYMTNCNRTYISSYTSKI